MQSATRSIVIIFVTLSLAGALAWAGSQSGQAIGRFPIFGLCVLVGLVIQWVGFIPAYIFNTEKFYDLFGTLAFLSLVTIALLFSSNLDPRSWLLGLCVTIWSLRLGIFLFKRIKTQGSDQRFDEIKTSLSRFLVAWTVQGLWVSFSIAAALAAITSVRRIEIGPWAIMGAFIWLVGFSIEVIADWQKSKFRKVPGNRDHFIRTGLWAWSRHPNYLGEILLWVGIAMIAYSPLQGWQHLTLLSPVFVAFLIIGVTGIPLLEDRANKKWSGDQAYKKYKEQTATLIPGVW